MTRCTASLWSAIVFGLMLTGLGACSPGRGLETVSLLRGLASQEAPDGVERKPIDFTVEGRERSGDLYEQDGREPRAHLVVVPGAVPEGKDDPRLVAFAARLAKARFTVLVPEIETVRRLTVSAGDADIIADALTHLENLPDTDKPLGVVAISYGAGPAMIAAHRAGLRETVDLAVMIGGYYDSAAVATYFTTGRFRDPETGTWQFQPPNAYGKWIFVRANAGRLDDAQDQALLRAMATRRLDDPQADLSDLETRLGPEGRSVLAFLDNRDPDRAPALIAGLPAGIRAELEALDLSRRDWQGAGPCLVLIHGKTDPIIPYSESLALEAAINSEDGKGRARAYLVDDLGHIEIGGVGLGDGWTLARAVYRVLSVRDGVPKACS